MDFFFCDFWKFWVLGFVAASWKYFFIIHLCPTVFLDQVVQLKCNYLLFLILSIFLVMKNNHEHNELVMNQFFYDDMFTTLYNVLDWWCIWHTILVKMCHKLSSGTNSMRWRMIWGVGAERIEKQLLCYHKIYCNYIWLFLLIQCKHDKLYLIHYRSSSTWKKRWMLIGSFWEERLLIFKCSS